MKDPETTNLESEEIIQLLRTIHESPHMTQRELACAVNVSLGKANYLLKALINKGFVKANNFKKSSNRCAYLYVLTPKGFEEKARITRRFLKRKMREYELLKKEIEKLEKEVAGL